MFGSFLQPQFIPCPECGASFEVQLAAFLASPRGRFETFYAERDRLRAAA